MLSGVSGLLDRSSPRQRNTTNKEQRKRTGISRSGRLGSLNWDLNQPASLTRILHNKYNVGFVYNPTIMYYVLGI